MNRPCEAALLLISIALLVQGCAPAPPPASNSANQKYDTDATDRAARNATLPPRAIATH